MSACQSPGGIGPAVFPGEETITVGNLGFRGVAQPTWKGNWNYAATGVWVCSCTSAHGHICTVVHVLLCTSMLARVYYVEGEVMAHVAAEALGVCV